MKATHAPCSCGCGELADECMRGGPALAAFTMVAPVGSRPRRYDQCDDTCTVDCGHCKGAGRPAS